MPADPMRALASIRQRAVDESRLSLAACLRVEQAALQALQSIEAAIRQEHMPNDVTNLPRDMNMFASWRARAREERHSALEALGAAQSRTAEARSALASARSAARSVERVMEERAAHERLREDTREAHALDDLSRARHRVRMINRRN